EAERKRAEAQKNREDAEGFLADALGAINAFHIRLNDAHLLNQPGQKPVRREVLREAEQFYRKLIARQGDSPAVRRQLGVAYLRLALVTSELETPVKGIPIARKGVAILETLAREQSTDRHQYNLGNGLLILGDQLTKARRLTEAKPVI